MVLFFFRTFMEFQGSVAEFVTQARDLLFSRPYLTALATTNWIAPTVTLAVLLVGYPTRSMVKRWFERCLPTSAANPGSVQWSRRPLPARKTAATSAASAKR